MFVCAFWFCAFRKFLRNVKCFGKMLFYSKPCSASVTMKESCISFPVITAFKLEEISNLHSLVVIPV